MWYFLAATKYIIYQSQIYLISIVKMDWAESLVTPSINTQLPATHHSSLNIDGRIYSQHSEDISSLRRALILIFVLSKCFEHVWNIWWHIYQGRVSSCIYAMNIFEVFWRLETFFRKFWLHFGIFWVKLKYIPKYKCSLYLEASEGRM